jgi:hypothetical protein
MITRNKGLAFALATLLLSCTTKNDASVELAAVCGFPDDATKCTFSSTCDTILMARPWVATRVSALAPNDTQNGLDLPIQINNRMKSNADPGTFRLNTHDFTAEELRLSYSSSPAISIPSRSWPVNAYVPAEGSTVAMLKLIPPETMAVIDAANLPALTAGPFAPNAHLEITLKLYGHTRDGSNIETEEWTVPVDVYDVDVPAARVFDPTCPGTTSTVTGVCPHTGQSASVSCQ